MDALLYAKILSDKSITDLKKIKYKYPNADIYELVELLKTSSYKSMPLPDFAGNNIVYMENVAKIRMNAVKLLLTPQSTKDSFGLKAMEDEIISTLTIENIDFSRDSVRNIMRGYAPVDESEERIYGIKKGLDFIADTTNVITEENIYTLYDLAISKYLDNDDKLKPGLFYRDDSVYIVGQEIEHTGLHHSKLQEYMAKLVEFINLDDQMDDLLKAASIHFYISYLHPYFDGNGRMARLIHLWYLHQKGYSSALFIPFSSYIERSRKYYYDAYTITERNAKLSNVIDITPFLVYFIDNVYNKFDNALPKPITINAFNKALDEGKITEKEKDIWNFVISAYGDGEFSTKQLEKDFGNAAYATIRGFVLKFKELGLLTGQKYGNKTKYSLKVN